MRPLIGKTPREVDLANPDALRRVGVELVADAEGIVYRCRWCGAEWRPGLAGWCGLARGWWRCPECGGGRRSD